MAESASVAISYVLSQHTILEFEFTSRKMLAGQSMKS